MLLIRISKKNQEYFRNLQTTTLSALAGRRMVVRFLASSSCTVWAPLVPLGTGSGLNTYCNTYNTGSQSLSQNNQHKRYSVSMISFYHVRKENFTPYHNFKIFLHKKAPKVTQFHSYGGICIKRISFTYI